jgi:hypothetical protein
VSLVILWRRARNCAWAFVVHVFKGHITRNNRDLMYIRGCGNPSRLLGSAKPKFLIKPVTYPQLQTRS